MTWIRAVMINIPTFVAVCSTCQLTAPRLFARAIGAGTLFYAAVWVGALTTVAAVALYRLDALPAIGALAAIAALFRKQWATSAKVLALRSCPQCSFDNEGVRAKKAFTFGVLVGPAGAWFRGPVQPGQPAPKG